MQRIFLLIILLLFGCKEKSGSKADLSTSYEMPVLKNITNETKQKYFDLSSKFYDSLFGKQGLNGGMIVAYYGNVIFEKYNGTAHINKSDTINEHTALHIASVSKTFTAMAILKLVEDSLINKNDLYAKYFPEFPYKDITVAMMLSHRSGLPNYMYAMEAAGWNTKPISNTDVLNFFCKESPALERPAGKGFGYSNTNYALLALLIEKISGKKYAAYLKEKFFIPLHMDDTYVFELKDTSTATPSYKWNGHLEPFNFLDFVYGDKNIYSTPRDLLKWDQALYKNNLFKKETLDAAFTPYSFEKLGVKNYGFGWRMYFYPDGHKIIYHNGWWHGNNSVLYRLVEDSATIIVLGNKFNKAIYHAVALGSVFNNYPEGIQGQEEDGNENKNADSLLVKKPKTKKQPLKSNYKNRKKRKR